MLARMGVGVYLIFGQDEFLVAQNARELLDELVPAEERTLGLEIIEGAADTVEAAVSAAMRCMQALETVGFFDRRKVVWFREVSFLTDTVVGRSDLVKEKVNELGALIKRGLMAGQTLVVTAGKVDKRYAFYKACKEAGELREFAVPDKPYKVEREARGRIREMLGKAGLKMGAAALEAFVARVGTDTRQIANEIEKLSVYVGDRRDVTLEDIEAVTTSSREALAWDLADAFGRRELGRALAVLRRLLFQKESPIGLLVVLGNRIRELMLYREALDNGWLTVRGQGERVQAGWGEVPAEVDRILSEELGRDPRATHPYRTALLARQAGGFTSEELLACQQSVMDAHEEAVSSRLDSGVIIELLLCRLLAAKPKAATRTM